MWYLLCLVFTHKGIASYQMMPNFKGTADAVAEYCTALSSPNAPNIF